MRLILFALVAIVVANIIADGLGRDADTQLAIHREAAQAKIDGEQRDILARLEGKHDGSVSEFVRDWQRAYPTANAERLQELRVIEQKINADVATAGQFTLAAKQRQANSLNASVTTLFGTKLEVRPGL